MELRDASFLVDEQPAHIERIYGSQKCNHGVHPICRFYGPIYDVDVYCSKCFACGKRIGASGCIARLCIW
jgi:hypothetical protein